MDEGTAVIWPEYRTYYDLMKLRVAEGPASFNSEIQNEPVDPADCLFQEEWFRYYDEDEIDVDTLTVVAAVDPSLGKSGKEGDYSAIITVGRGEDGSLYVLDADIERRAPEKIIEDVQALWMRRRFAAGGVESNQFQEFFRQEMLRRFNKAGQYPPLMPIVSTKDKRLRIQRLQPLVKNGILRFKRSQRLLLDQLRFYPSADHDDGPDGLEMAVSMIEQRFSVQTIKTGPIKKAREQELNKVFG